MEMVN